MGLIFKNGIPYAGIPDEIDAATVGGHTVEADVPAAAAFTDTINSDITAEGNPVILKELQGGVPFSEITVKGENISGQEMTLTATGKNQLPITVTSGTGAGVTYTVDNDEITISGTTTGVATITVSAPNITITEDMRLSYRGNLSGMSPKATILRNGETIYPTPNDTTGSKLLAGDVLQNVYIQQQSADVAVSGSAKFQLEYGTEVTEYEKYASETYTFTPNSIEYIIPTDITQKEGINILAINVEGAALSATGVKEDKAIEKLWNREIPTYDDTEILNRIAEVEEGLGGHTVKSDVPENAVFTDTTYTHPSYTAKTGVPTANVAPAFGGTFAVTQPVSNSTGHITAMNSRTVTIPNTTATTSSAGLMSASDKTKLDAINTVKTAANGNGSSASISTTISGLTGTQLMIIESQVASVNEGNVCTVKIANPSKTLDTYSENRDSTGDKFCWTTVLTGLTGTTLTITAACDNGNIGGISVTSVALG